MKKRDLPVVHCTYCNTEKSISEILEESFRLYEQGMKLLQKCNENIDHVEKQMLQIDEEGHTHEFS